MSRHGVHKKRDYKAENKTRSHVRLRVPIVHYIHKWMGENNRNYFNYAINQIIEKEGEFEELLREQREGFCKILRERDLKRFNFMLAEFKVIRRAIRSLPDSAKEELARALVKEFGKGALDIDSEVAVIAGRSELIEHIVRETSPLIPLPPKDRRVREE